MKKQDFTIEFNGRATWMVVDCYGDCWGTFSTERKAKTFFKKVEGA